MTKFYEVSNATHRTQDLLPAFLDALKGEAPATYAHFMACSFIPAHAMEDDDAEWWDSEDAHEKLLELTEILEEAAFNVSYRYFGTLEGDGACFGFWPDLEAAGELPKVNDPADLDELPDGECEALFVNDHGNVTLFARDETGEWQEIWAVV